MAAQVIQFPKKLEWQELPCWVGIVKGTQIFAKVEKALDGEAYQWHAWNDNVPLGSGLRASRDEAMDAAKAAIEEAILVVRALSP